MDFDLDDPLGDLLSDDSDGSFFGGATSKKKAPTTKEKVNANSKAKMADLFGVESDTTNEKFNASSIDTATKIGSTAATILPTEPPKKSIRPITPTTQPSQPSQPKPKPVKKEISFDDSDDILQELGFDPKNPRSGSIRKTNIIDNLLDFSKSARDTSKLDTSKIGQTAAEAGNTETTTSTYRQSPSFGRPRTATRTPAEYTANDPLGFFSTPTKKPTAVKTEEAPIAKSKPSKPAAVDWLGINLNQEIAVDKLVTTTASDAERNRMPETQPAVSVKSESNVAVAPVNEMPVSDLQKFDLSTNLTQSIQQFDITTLQNEGALQSLKQQENQLRIAGQMKQQERILMEMNAKQKVLLEQQERQFNELLQRQVSRQAALENSIHRQQEQIGSYMNLLLAQPTIALPSVTRNSNESAVEAAGDSGNEKQFQSKRDTIELEADVKRLELEKLRLEDILQSVRTNHEQELDLIENSHKSAEAN